MTPYQCPICNCWEDTGNVLCGIHNPHIEYKGKANSRFNPKVQAEETAFDRRWYPEWTDDELRVKVARLIQQGFKACAEAEWDIPVSKLCCRKHGPQPGCCL